MLNHLKDAFSDNFMAHGYCFLWKPELVWLHGGSDFLIALAYYSIPLMLIYFVHRRQDVPFQGIFLLFSTFILSCGTAHLLEIWTLWHPDYWLSGSMKAFTAIVSLYTASELVPLIPKALTLPSPAQLEAANIALEKEIAEHKQTVKALKSSQQRLSLLVQQTPLAVIEWNLDGEVIDWNPAAESIFGYSYKQAIGCHATQLIWPECWQEDFQLHWQNLLAGEGGNYTCSEHSTPDGRTIVCEWYNIPLIESNGSVIGVASLAQDITQRKQAEEALRGANEDLEQRVQERTQQLGKINEELQVSETQLREKADALEQTLHQLKQAQAQLVQSEKMSSLGMMVAGIAHEINNPVGFVYCNLAPAREYIQELHELISLYRRYYPNPVSTIQDYIEEIDLDFVIEDLAQLLASMQVGAERIRDIVTTLRTFSRLDESEMKPVNIHEGLDSTLLILQHRLKEKAGRPGIEVIKKYSPLPLVECYSGQLNQVFMNLLVNAIDALESQRVSPCHQDEPPNGLTVIETEKLAANSLPHIQISTEVVEDLDSTEHSKSVVIRIADNGPGMTERVRPLIFDPFFTTKPVGQGTGLGLSISYQIVVAKHGGQLHCVSTPGQGTEFIIQIPILQSQQKSSTNTNVDLAQAIPENQSLVRQEIKSFCAEIEYPLHSVRNGYCAKSW